MIVVPRHPTTRLFIPLLIVATVAGCASQKRTVPNPSVDGPSVTGVWGAVLRDVDKDGDDRIDRHELQLVQRGQQVLGFWNRLTTWISQDGRPFQCGGETRYERETRSVVVGVLTTDGAQLQEIRELPQRRQSAPCPLVPGRYKTCELARRGNKLQVDCDQSARFSFDLRLGKPIPLALALGQTSSVTGVWTWHHRSGDIQGDTKVEDEVWHLFQRGNEIEGYYDRHVLVRSGDGRRFVCNNALSYGNLARFHLRGYIAGSRLLIQEIGFSAKDGRCESKKRVLDQYKGLIAPDGTMIHLSWDKGSQLLYRRY